MTRCIIGTSRRSDQAMLEKRQHFECDIQNTALFALDTFHLLQQHAIPCCMNQSCYTIQDTKPLKIKVERGFSADTVTMDWLRWQLVQELPNQPLQLNGKHTRVALHLCFYPVSLVHLMIPHVRYHEIHRQPFFRSQKEVSHPTTLSFDWTPATRSQH
jgi:hypothetical protein